MFQVSLGVACVRKEGLHRAKKGQKTIDQVDGMHGGSYLYKKKKKKKNGHGAGLHENAVSYLERTVIIDIHTYNICMICMTCI